MGTRRSLVIVRWGGGVPRDTDGTAASANKEVQKSQEQVQKRRRGSYHHYDDETRAKIAKLLFDHGNKAAASKFSAELRYVISYIYTLYM